MARRLLAISGMNAAPNFRRGLALVALAIAGAAPALPAATADPQNDGGGAPVEAATPSAGRPAAAAPGEAAAGFPTITAQISAAAPPERSPYEDIAGLESLARVEAEREFRGLGEHQRLSVGPIDAHAEYARCRLPVRAALTTPHHMQDRATIEIKCGDPKPWHLYVQVRVIGFSPAVVAAHAIVAGTVIKASDLKIEERELSQLPPGFLDDPGIAIGLTAARPISEGKFISNQELVAEKAVTRGQSVTLLAAAGGISVRMAGKAMTDGLINQRVRVQNLSSGKVVEGIARSEQVVEIVLN